MGWGAAWRDLLGLGSSHAELVHEMGHEAMGEGEGAWTGVAERPRSGGGAGGAKGEEGGPGELRRGRVAEPALVARRRARAWGTRVGAGQGARTQLGSVACWAGRGSECGGGGVLGRGGGEA